MRCLFASIKLYLYNLTFLYLDQSASTMNTVTVTNRQVKDFCTEFVEMKQGISENGEPLFIKFIKIDTIDQLRISQCLQLNRGVLRDSENLRFSQHFLKIQEQLSNNKVVGFATQPYDCNLQSFLKGNTLTEKEAMFIFDQILKAVYSLYFDGYATRNLRSHHFVRSKLNQQDKTVWKLESLVYNHEYKHANGATIQYLWSPKHQAPECFGKHSFQDEDYDSMLVWNLGSILVELLLNIHRFSTYETMQKFKGMAFSFQALGIKPQRISMFSTQLKKTLSYMLHFDPKQRTKLTRLFENPFLSTEVAKHYESNKSQMTHRSKMSFGKSSFKPSAFSVKTQEAMEQVNKTLKERQANNDKLLASKISGVIEDLKFLEDLSIIAISTKIPNQNSYHFNKPLNLQPQKPKNFKKPVSPISETDQMVEIINSSPQDIRKALQLYKCYFDQSQLLMLAKNVLQILHFENMSPQQSNELKMLIEYAITFVSLMNLNYLAQGFNQNRNIFKLKGNTYTAFQNCEEYSAFQRIVNFKRKERVIILSHLADKIQSTNQKPLLASNPSLYILLKADYKKATFQDIKTEYRFLVKHAYDTLAKQYNQLGNQLKPSELAKKLAQNAMYMTYCLTIDKLYIKEHLTDNFKHYFLWSQQPPSEYVALSEFQDYLFKADKEVLIEHSRFILKKYYSI